MPNLGRQPSTSAEARIDYGRIQAAQERRRLDTLSELRGLLLRIERITVAYAVEQLAVRKNRGATAKYKMPMANKYRAVIRKRALSAHRRGRQDVTEEVGARKMPPLSGPQFSRVRAEADALAREHRERLEADLRREWDKATRSPTSREQIKYVTKKVFADFAGWEQPLP